MADKTKADQSGPFKEFIFEEWLQDGIEGMRGRMKERRAHFDPTRFRKHVRNAQKEHLLAVRSLIDSAIECLEQTERKPKA